MTLTAEPRPAAAAHAHAGDTWSMTAGAQQRASTALPPAPPIAVAELDRVRAAVSAALTGFLDVQRETLAAMDEALLPVVDEVRALADGGKRLRPLFAYWGWRGVRPEGPTEDDDAVLRAVAALEFVHASALVHDDVMDGALTRRGRPATHVGFAGRHGDGRLAGDGEAFGVGAAILVGDLALVWSDELLRRSGLSSAALSRARAVWDTMRTEVTAGQYLDLLRAAGGLPGAQGALTVARYKSAGYTVQRPLQLGAAIAGAGPRTVEACSAIGLPLGEAFQLRDDVLGVFGDPAVTGKPAGDDLREGKRTFLVAMALDQASNDDDRRLLTRMLGSPDLDTAGVSRAREIIVRSGALAATEHRIEELMKSALSALDATPLSGGAGVVLRRLAEAAVYRST